MLRSIVQFPRWRGVALTGVAASPSSVYLSSPLPRWTRCFSERKHRNAANLRNARKQLSREPVSNVVDYRYRKGSESSVDDTNNNKEEGNLAEPVSSATKKKQSNMSIPSPATKKPKKQFISFFDEIDSLMEERRQEKWTQSKISPVKARVVDTPQPPKASPSAIRKIIDGARPVKLGLVEGRSIFDAFPIPDPPAPPNPHAFDEEAYRQYKELLDEAVVSQGFLRTGTRKEVSKENIEIVENWLSRPEKSIGYDFPVLDNFIKNGARGEDMSTIQLKFRGLLQEQRELFLEHHGMTIRHHKLIMGVLIHIGNLSARKARSAPLEIAIEKVKEAGILLHQKTVNNYLFAATSFAGSSSRRRRSRDHSTLGMSVLDMFQSKPDSNASETLDDETKEDESEENIVDLSEEIAAFHDILYKPSEQSLTVRVKALISKGRTKAAEELLNFIPSDGGGLRLRTYFPVLRCYLEQGDFSTGLRLFSKMRSTPTVLFEVETYVFLIATLAEAGYFRTDSAPINGAEELGFSPCGPLLLDQLVACMADDTMEINSSSARRLYGAFETAYRGTSLGKNLNELHPLAPLAVDKTPALDDELVAGRVLIDTESAKCTRTGAHLRLITLDDDERAQFKKRLIELASIEFNQLRIGNMKEGHGKRAIESFAAWLDGRTEKPFTAIIDGANVAFYMQNFEKGKFNYHQIQFMVDTLERMGENPLVIIPHKYGSPSFTMLNAGILKQQRLTSEELAIMRQLSDEGKLFRVQSRCLDDYYWMLASVSDQLASRQGQDLTVAAQDESGRWPGIRPMLVTNDQMRDHRIELVVPRLFRRWYSSFIVNYNFTAFFDDECPDKEIGFCPADFFSREIQMNPTYRDSDGAQIGMAWHFPVSDWEANERFCLRLPIQTPPSER